MEEVTSLHNWLFISSSTGNDTDGGSTETWDGLSWARWKSDSGSAAIIGVSYDGGVSAWTSWIWSFVSNWWFNVADCGSFRDSVDGENVTCWNSCFSSAEQILSGISSFGSEEIFGVVLIFIWIPEIDFDQGASTSWVVEDSSNNSFNISLSLSEIEISISWGCDSLSFGCCVNTTDFTFSLAYIKWIFLPLMTLPITTKILY